MRDRAMYWTKSGPEECMDGHKPMKPDSWFWANAAGWKILHTIVLFTIC